MNGPAVITVGVAPLGWAAGKVDVDVEAAAAEEGGHHVTPQQVKNQFRERGETVASWADAHGYRRSDVYRVLNGFTACRRGVPHEIAVKLGLKPNPAKTPD